MFASLLRAQSQIQKDRLRRRPHTRLMPGSAESSLSADSWSPEQARLAAPSAALPPLWCLSGRLGHTSVLLSLQAMGLTIVASMLEGLKP